MSPVRSIYCHIFVFWCFSLVILLLSIGLKSCLLFLSTRRWMCLMEKTWQMGLFYAGFIMLLSDSFVTPMVYSPSGSSVHGISQARILEWIAIYSSRGSSQSRDKNLHLQHWQADSLALNHLGINIYLPSSKVGNLWLGSMFALMIMLHEQKKVLLFFFYIS